ncbi:MAG TPA: universal stress protein [Acidimicrobiales bacterium]|jgi:nucleotide-binding universal stress UspA family protein|nr:universal stress protein [Acidimicrobiales bacterium]
MFERLLLAIDDSPASEVAVVFATAFAQRCSSSVHVVHINEYQVAGRGVTLHTHDEAAELVTRAVLELRAAGVRASGSGCVARYRQVPQCIVEASRRHQADAIILGSNRQRWLSRIFSLRVRERTTRLTSLPVLTAPSPLKVATLSPADLVQAQVNAELMALLP